MDYDFNTEKQFNYKGLSLTEVIKHLVKFTSDIWQIHPFCEGNTRVTAICKRICNDEKVVVVSHLFFY